MLQTYGFRYIPVILIVVILLAACSGRQTDFELRDSASSSQLSNQKQNTGMFHTGASLRQKTVEFANRDATGDETGTFGQKQRFQNTLGMEFVYIPAGTFAMGSPQDEYRRYKNEWQHQVTISQGFYLQTTEVTQSQWKELIGENPSHFSSCGGDCPVEEVNWYEVQKFIEALNRKEKTNGYRLPTEAEWEYASRAGSRTAFTNGPFSSNSTSGRSQVLGQVGWYFRNSEQGTHRVAQKNSNAWGLYDMHGNVWEWCQDWEDKYPFHAVTDPSGPKNGLAKVRRGGSWSHYPMWCRSAYRSWFDPDNSSAEIGFRLVKDITEAASCADKDGDGVCDSGDRCPGTPVGIKVDARGCSLDSDQDGVIDPMDQCPETPYGVMVDETGCPPGTPDVQKTECIVLRDIVFDFDSARIKENMLPVLEKAAAIVKDRSQPVLIEGHTCSIGSESYNQDLSERRAASVKEFLVQSDIPAGAIEIKGLGESRPKYDNSTPEGRNLNRRVEIYFQ